MYNPMDAIVLAYLIYSTNVLEYIMQCTDYIADVNLFNIDQ